MPSRYFAFGCSYVDSRWGTVADLIGANFDEFYNAGRPGSCNTHSLDRFIELDKIHHFSPDTDFITIGVTGFYRFSTVDSENHVWLTPGDFVGGENYSHENIKLIRKIDNVNWAVYRSWVALNALSTILKTRNIKHVIYPSIDNLLFLSDYPTTAGSKQKVHEILALCDIKESIDEFIMENFTKRGVDYDDGSSDDHPTQLQHYDYLKKYFPQYNTDKTKAQYDYLESIFTRTSMNTQTLNMMKYFKNTHRKHLGQLWVP